MNLLEISHLQLSKWTKIYWKGNSVFKKHFMRTLVLIFPYFHGELHTLNVNKQIDRSYSKKQAHRKF